MKQKEMDGLDLLALLVVGLGSGSAFMFTRIAVEELSPLQIVFARVALGVPPVWAVMALTRAWTPPSLSLIRGVTLLALLDTIVPLLLTAWAGSRIDSSTAAVLVSTMPLFTVLIAAATRQDEDIGGTVLLGVVTGFLGVIVLAGPQALDPSSSDGAGIAAVVLASIAYAAGAVYARSLLKRGDPISLTGLKLTVSLVVLAPLALGLEGAGTYSSLQTDTLLAVTVLGIGSTGLGRCVHLWMVRRSGSVRSSLIGYAIPVIALFLGWAVLDEPLTEQKLAGAGLIVVGVAGVSFGRMAAGWLLAMTRGREPALQPVPVRVEPRR
jgi:drug/metabolite transporter (DMT)-like permease